MELYKVYINHDPGMTLTYFMARSAKVAYPRSQVSVYRTIGLLVIFLHFTRRDHRIKRDIDLCWKTDSTPCSDYTADQHLYCTGQFVTDLVGNLGAQFSHVATKLLL